MKKRVIWLAMILLMAVIETRAAEFYKKFSIALKPTGIFAISGQFTDSVKLKDVLSTGLGLGMGLRYEINENIYIDAGYSYDWIPLKEENRPYPYKDQMPAFDMQIYSLNGTFFLKSGYFIEPFLTVGAGLSSWKFSEDTLGTGVWPAPGNFAENFSDSSFLLNVGLGAEGILWRHFSIFVEVKYNYLFSRNVGKFGTDDFTQQDFLTIGLGIIFNFVRK